MVNKLYIIVNRLYVTIKNLFIIINQFFVVVSNLYTIINKLFKKKYFKMDIKMDIKLNKTPKIGYKAWNIIRSWNRIHKIPKTSFFSSFWTLLIPIFQLLTGLLCFWVHNYFRQSKSQSFLLNFHGVPQLFGWCKSFYFSWWVLLYIFLFLLVICSN